MLLSVDSGLALGGDRVNRPAPRRASHCNTLCAIVRQSSPRHHCAGGLTFNSANAASVRFSFQMFHTPPRLLRK
jgi:hypothetical protein